MADQRAGLQPVENAVQPPDTYERSVESVHVSGVYCPLDGGGSTAVATIYQGRPLLVLRCDECGWEGFVHEGVDRG
jgi:hypothetical protein